MSFYGTLYSVPRKTCKFRLSQNLTKFDVIARFCETIPTVKSVSSSEIKKIFKFLPKLRFCHFLENWNFLGSHMTSPFSIYILIGLTYPDYKIEPFATYIDSSSGLCLSKLACFPDEYHMDLPAIQGKDISNQNIILTKGIRHPRILIDKYIFKLPHLFSQY